MTTLSTWRHQIPLGQWGGTAVWQRLGGVNVRTKILGMVLALTAILGLGITWQVRTVMERVFIGELESRGLSVVSDLAARSTDSILLNNTFAVYELLANTVANHPDALYAVVVDANGQVLAHTFGDAGFPTALLPKPTDVQALAGGVPRSNGIFQSNEGVVHEFVAPIFGGRAGLVRVGLSENRLKGIINAVTGQMLFTTLIVGMAGIAGAISLTWLLTRPILDLVEVTKRVRLGNLAVRAPHWADDEIGALADAFNDMVAALESSERAIAEKDAARTHLLEQLINAQEEERKRIARELHDGVGQALTSLMVGMKVVCRLDNVADMQAKSEELRVVATDTLEQVRLLSRQLRPSVLDDLGLAVALDHYCDEFRQLYTTMTVDLHCDLPNRLPPLVGITLYRIIQEAMTNAARHGGGTTVSVLVSERAGHVQAIVEDDGTGFDPIAERRAGQGVGIHGMIERAELVGGHLHMESGPKGTTVYAEIPL